MGEMDADIGPPPLMAIFDGARQFGLTDAEVLATVHRCAYEMGPDATVAELVDELTGALAHDVLAKQRRELSGAPAVAPEQRPTRSKDRR